MEYQAILRAIYKNATECIDISVMVEQERKQLVLFIP